MTYASYTKPTDDIALSSVSAASGNGFFEVALGGMIVSQQPHLLGPESIISAGEKASPSHWLFSLPGVLNTCLGHFRRSILFSAFYCSYYLFTFHAPACHCFLEEGLNLNRQAAVTLLGFITAVDSLSP